MPGQPSRSMVAENRNESVYDRDHSQPQADSSSDSNTGAPPWSSASGYAEGSQAADTYERL